MNMGNSIQPMSDCNSLHVTSSQLEDTAENRFYSLEQITGKLCMEGASFANNNNLHLIVNDKKLMHQAHLGEFSEKENELMQCDGLGDTQQRSLLGSTTVFNERQVGILRELLKDQEDVVADEHELLRSFKRVVVSTGGGRRLEFSQEQIEAYKRELIFNASQQLQQQQQLQHQQQYFQDCKDLDEMWMSQQRINENYDTQQENHPIEKNNKNNNNYQNHQNCLSENQRMTKIHNEWEKYKEEQKRFGQQSPLQGDCSISCLSNNVEYTSRVFLNSKLNQDSLNANEKFNLQALHQQNYKEYDPQAQIATSREHAQPNQFSQQPCIYPHNIELLKRGELREENYKSNLSEQSNRNNRFQGQQYQNDSSVHAPATAAVVFPRNQGQTDEQLLPSAAVKVISTVNQECVPNPIKKIRSFSGNAKGDNRMRRLSESLEAKQSSCAASDRRMSSGNILANNNNNSSANIVNLSKDTKQLIEKNSSVELTKLLPLQQHLKQLPSRPEQRYLDNNSDHDLAYQSSNHLRQRQESSQDMHQHYHSDPAQSSIHVPKYPSTSKLPSSSSSSSSAHISIPSSSEFKVSPPERLTSMLNLCSKPPIETPTLSTPIIFDSNNCSKQLVLPPSQLNSVLPFRHNSISYPEQQQQQQQDPFQNDYPRGNIAREVMPSTTDEEIKNKRTINHPEMLRRKSISLLSSSVSSSLRQTVEPPDSGVKKKTIKGIRKSRESSLDGSFIRPSETDRFQLAGFEKIKSIHITEEDFKGGSDRAESSQGSVFRDKKEQCNSSEEGCKALEQKRLTTAEGIIEELNFPLKPNQSTEEKEVQVSNTMSKKSYSNVNTAIYQDNIQELAIASTKQASYSSSASAQKDRNCSEKKQILLKAATPMKQEEEEEEDGNDVIFEEDQQLQEEACLGGGSGQTKSDLKLNLPIDFNRTLKNQVDIEREANPNERVFSLDSQAKTLADLTCRTKQSSDTKNNYYAELQDEMNNSKVNSFRNCQEKVQPQIRSPSIQPAASNSSPTSSCSDKATNSLNPKSALHFQYDRILGNRTTNLNQISCNNSRESSTADIFALSRKIKTPTKEEEEDIVRDPRQHPDCNQELGQYQEQQQQRQQVIEGQFETISNTRYPEEGCLADELAADCEHAEKLLFRSESYYLSPQVRDMPDQSQHSYQSKKDLELLKIMHMLEKTTSNGQQNCSMQQRNYDQQKSIAQYSNFYGSCRESNQQQMLRAEDDHKNNENHKSSCGIQPYCEQYCNDRIVPSQPKLTKRSLQVLQEQSINVQLDFNTPVTSNERSNINSGNELYPAKNSSCSGLKLNSRQQYGGIVDHEGFNEKNEKRNNQEFAQNDQEVILVHQQSSKYHSIIQQQQQYLTANKINSSRTSRKTSVDQNTKSYCNSIQVNNHVPGRSSIRQIDYVEVFQQRLPSTQNGLLTKGQKQISKDRFQDYQNTTKMQQRQATHQKVSQLYNQHKAAILIESKNKKESSKTTRQLSTADSRKKPATSSHTSSYSKLDAPTGIPRNTNNQLERHPHNQLSEIVHSLNEQVRFDRPILEIIKQSSQAPLPKQQQLQHQRIQSSNRSTMNFK